MSSLSTARASRRTLVQGAAWSVPAIAIAGAAPAFAGSGCPSTPTSSTLRTFTGDQAGSYVVVIPKCVSQVRYVIRGASGGLASENGADGMQLTGLLDLGNRNEDTVLTIKVGSRGKWRGETPSDTYRRGASLGGFGTRREYGGSVIVDGGDGGGSTGIFVPNTQTVSAAAHSVTFNELLALAAGGAGAGNGSLNENEPTVGYTWPYPGNAFDSNAAWQAVGGSLSGYAVNGAVSTPSVAKNKNTGATFLTMPSGGAANGATGGTNSFANPGAVYGDGARTTFHPGSAGSDAAWGGHGGNGAYYTSDINQGFAYGGGGGGAGFAGGASGLSYGSFGSSDVNWARILGSAGGAGSSFYTDRTINGVTTANRPNRYYARQNWQERPSYNGYVSLSWQGDALVTSNYQDIV